MKEWLESVVADLIELQGVDSGRRLASALTIACCFYFLSIFHPKFDKFLVPLLKLLELKVDLERKQCPDYDLVCSLLPKNKGKL